MFFKPFYTPENLWLLGSGADAHASKIKIFMQSDVLGFVFYE